jgi:hypothetical protein
MHFSQRFGSPELGCPSDAKYRLRLPMRFGPDVPPRGGPPNIASTVGRAFSPSVTTTVAPDASIVRRR